MIVRNEPISFPFADRREAGKLLARELAPLKASHPLVLAVPRGGVPVGYEVAKRLNADLDLLLVRKLGAPHQPELAIGAIVDGNPPQISLNHDIIAHLSLPSAYLDNECYRQLRELERRREDYLAGRDPIPVAGRTVIAIDDGIATGASLRAGLRAVRAMKPARLVLAVPVAAPDSLISLASECDEVVCLVTPEPFYAVGAYYEDFAQTTDSEVKQLLNDYVVAAAVE